VTDHQERIFPVVAIEVYEMPQTALFGLHLVAVAVMLETPMNFVHEWVAYRINYRFKLFVSPRRIKIAGRLLQMA